MAAAEDELDAFLAEVHHALAAAGPLSEKARTGFWGLQGSKNLISAPLRPQAESPIALAVWRMGQRVCGIRWRQPVQVASGCAHAAGQRP